MNTKDFRKLGVFLLITAGVIFAFERVGSMIAQSKEIAAMYEIRMSGSPAIQITGFWDNVFVPILTFLGVILLGISFVRR